MEVICRILEPKDSLNYRRLRLESLQRNPESFGAKYEEQANLKKLYVEEHLEQGSNLVVMLGAFIDYELIGLCGLKMKDGNQLEIIQMYVTGNVRGQAIGQKLLNLAKSILKKRRAKNLVLTVHADNYVAVKTYKNAGFNVQSKKGKEVIMVCEL